MFPVFPRRIRAFSVFWISCRDPYGRSALIIELHSTTRNIENIRNRIEASGVGRSSHVEQTWNGCVANGRSRTWSAMLNGGRTKSAAAEPPKRKRRRISAAKRKRIAEAQRTRWAAIKQQSAPSLQTVKSEAPKRKRRLSAAGRKRIIEATKRRWALKRAELEQAQRASSKKGATGKVTAKRAA